MTNTRKDDGPGDPGAAITETDLLRIILEQARVQPDFFAPLERLLLLPPAATPDGDNAIARRDTTMSTALGLLIAARPEAFGLPEPDERFDPTELAANFARDYLTEIHDLLCRGHGLEKAAGGTRTVVSRLAQALSIGVVASQSMVTGIAALLLLAILRATRGALCRMTDDDVILSLIDPRVKFKRTLKGRLRLRDPKKSKSDGTWKGCVIFIFAMILLIGGIVIAAIVTS